MAQTTYLDSDSSRDYIRELGVHIGENALKDHRSRQTGPRYVLINGRALYTREWIDEWIAEQAARPITRRRRKNAVSQSAA